MDLTPEIRDELHDAATPDDRRQHQRVGVMWMATLRTPGGFVECMVIDLSRGGAKLALGTHIPLAPAAPVALVIEGYGTLQAEAVWQRADFAGIRFRDAAEIVGRMFGAILPL